MNRYARALILQQVLMTISTVILIYCGFGVSGAMIGIVISSIVHICLLDLLLQGSIFILYLMDI